MKKLTYSFRVFAIAAAFIGMAAISTAQVSTPAASPHAYFKQTVGLTEVEVDYSRPSAKGREIFGNLVPFGKVWRTGANQPTKITFSDDVTIGGKDLAAGTYALYTIPGKTEWTIIIYGATNLWGSNGYDQSQDVLRVTVKPTKLKNSVETFTVGIDALKNDSALLYIDWETTRAAVEIGVPTDSKVMAQIDALKGTPEFDNPNVLWAAGSYYHAAGKDLNKALEWVSKSIELRDQPAFWMYAQKARIEVDLGKKDAAKASAEKTLELATAANNADYQKIAKDILAKL